MHFVTGCVNTAKKAPAQGTGHHVSGPLQKKHEKRERKKKKNPKKGRGERARRKGQAADWLSVSPTYGHGATVASHDATLRRGIQLVVVIA